MPNYHTNNLVIAADEENMRKVLTRMAENLAANDDQTKFSLDQIEGLTAVSELCHEVKPYIDGYYWLAFAGAPIDQEVLGSGSEAWGINEVSRSYLNGLATAFGNVAAQFSDVGSLEVSFAPTARPMSDTANVSLDSYGNNFVLRLDYDTAWEPNSEDVDAFFMGLPSGDYGIAFYDADEIDEYESINAFSGLHHGRAGLRSVEKTVADEYLTSDQLRNLANAALDNPVSDISDIALLADNIAAREWSRLDWIVDGDDDDDWTDDSDDSYDFEGADNNPSRPWNTHHPINWNHPDDSDLSEIDELITKTMEGLPRIVGMTGSAYEGCEANFDTLVPGDRLKLVSNWDTPYFSPVGIEVYTEDGRRIGNLDSYYIGLMQLQDTDRTIFACILPHIRAYAETFKPLFAKMKGSTYPTVTVRLEVNDDSLSGIYDEVHNLLKRPLSERVLTSDMEEAR